MALSILDVGFAIIGGAIALLVARGMYLIGTGSDAEFEARQRMNGAIGGTGWVVLDWLRNAELPTVDRLLELAGRESKSQQVRVYHCTACRHEWTHKGGGWPDCPNCGHDRTIQI